MDGIKEKIKVWAEMIESEKLEDVLKDIQVCFLLNYILLHILFYKHNLFFDIFIDEYSCSARC